MNFKTLIDQFLVLVLICGLIGTTILFWDLTLHYNTIRKCELGELTKFTCNWLRAMVVFPPNSMMLYQIMKLNPYSPFISSVQQCIFQFVMYGGMIGLALKFGLKFISYFNFPENKKMK